MCITRLVAIAAVLAAAAAAVAPADAQSVLQRFFGPGGSRAPQYRYGRMGHDGYMSRVDRYDGYDGWQEDVTAYNTMCVRLCDGFYFPISYGVRRERLYKDNRTCMRRCDGEARLFYFPTQGGSVETMVDMRGRPYTSLANAFRYRTSLVAGCMCQRAPWSEETASRQQDHGATETHARAEPEEEARYGDEQQGEARRLEEPDFDGGDPDYDARHVYAEPPRYYQPWPRYQRLPRTPWARGWRNY